MGFYERQYFFQSPVSQSRKYRPDIDGLRAVAALPVVLYHTGYEAFSGGFVGVDIFFVISGFLITSILAEDIQRERFSLVVKIKRKSPEHPPQFQGVLRLAEGSKRLILSTSVILRTPLASDLPAAICDGRMRHGRGLRSVSPGPPTAFRQKSHRDDGFCQQSVFGAKPAAAAIFRRPAKALTPTLYFTLGPCRWRSSFMSFSMGSVCAPSLGETPRICCPDCGHSPFVCLKRLGCRTSARRHVYLLTKRS